MRDAGSRGLSPARAAVWHVLRLLAALSLIATAFAALARAWWFFELFSHFRVQLIATQLVLLAAVLLARRPRWALTLALACVINAVPIRAWLLPDGNSRAAPDTAAAARPDAAPEQRIRIVSANVLATNPDARGLIEVLRAADPDVFAILELTQPYMDSLSRFAAAWPHRVLLPEPGTFGIGVYSRWPLENIEVLELEGFAAIDARIGGQPGGWHFLAVHLLPPVSSAMAAQRNAQLGALARHVRTIEAPQVVVGDFNLSPYSPLFGDFLAQTRLYSTLRGRGPRRTWPSFFPPLGIPIDHVLVSDDFAVTGYARAGDVGSDHYPIIVDMIRRQLPLD